MKQPPSQLRQDNDGHWYLVPEDQIARFEAALLVVDEDGGSAFNKVKKITIDGPQSLRILVWEDMS